MWLFSRGRAGREPTSRTPRQVSNGEIMEVAVMMGSASVVRQGLALGANPNEPGRGGQPPLALALGLEKWEAAEAPVEGGADPNGTDTVVGMTPLYMAVTKKIAHEADRVRR